HDIEARRLGYSPAAARNKVLGLRRDIDAMLAERAQLVRSLYGANPGCRYLQVADLEERILIDVRDTTLNEFAAFHASARRLLALQQSLYTFDRARNTLGGIGSHFAWRGQQDGNRHNNTTAGLFYTLSGALTVMSPFTSRAIGMVVAGRQKHYMKAVT